MKGPSWLEDAVFYQIYPQSFYDSNGDGIGDIKGIIQKLDYIKELGCNGIWLNSVYDSPFMDAGYDVRNYKKVADRYGTNEDLAELFRTAHSKGIRIILDLVPGHTSDEHPWFLESKKAAANEFSDRYIYTDSVWESPTPYRFICGLCERNGNYMVNFFSSQPALNYGFYEITYPSWQLSYKHPECRKTAEAMQDIMRYWLDLGADGFRVDMADSLVKNDEEKIATAHIWRSIRKMMDENYPDAVMISEWCNPERAIKNAGFHMDFYLDHKGNGYSTLFRYEEDGQNKSFFCKEGRGDVSVFSKEYVRNYNMTKELGYISFFTCNHDICRLTRTLDTQAIKLAYGMIFTLPGVPFLYYGDEIGMRYLEGLVSKEGGYHRTGSRTPMQWNNEKNLGFSTASKEKLYIPIDSDKDAPTVENQKGKPGSIYETVTDMIALRRKYKALSNKGDFKILYAEKNKYPLVYQRDEFLVFINPCKYEVQLDAEIAEFIYSIGSYQYKNNRIILSGQSFVLAVQQGE